MGREVHSKLNTGVRQGVRSPGVHGVWHSPRWFSSGSQTLHPDRLDLSLTTLLRFFPEPIYMFCAKALFWNKRCYSTGEVRHRGPEEKNKLRRSRLTVLSDRAMCFTDSKLSSRTMTGPTEEICTYSLPVSRLSASHRTRRGSLFSQQTFSNFLLSAATVAVTSPVMICGQSFLDHIPAQIHCGPCCARACSAFHYLHFCAKHQTMQKR